MMMGRDVVQVLGENCYEIIQQKITDAVLAGEYEKAEGLCAVFWKLDRYAVLDAY